MVFLFKSFLKVLKQYLIHPYTFLTSPFLPEFFFVSVKRAFLMSWSYMEYNLKPLSITHHGKARSRLWKLKMVRITRSFNVFPLLFQQGCCVRSSLLQRDVRSAVTHKIAKCRFIFQNWAAGRTHGSTPHHHQAHQIERQGRWNLWTLTSCFIGVFFCTLIIISTFPRSHIAGIELQNLPSYTKSTRTLLSVLNKVKTVNHKDRL